MKGQFKLGKRDISNLGSHPLPLERLYGRQTFSAMVPSPLDKKSNAPTLAANPP